MKRKAEFGIYTCIWGLAIIILIFTMVQNMGDAKVINYSGIVRGTTQKVVKEELLGIHADDEIKRIEGILDNLLTGDGEYDLMKVKNADFQNKLMDVIAIWNDVKEEITVVRNGGDSHQLYLTSEYAYDKMNAMVYSAEAYANHKLVSLIVAILAYLVGTVGFFTIWNRKKHKELLSVKYKDELTGLSNYTGFLADVETCNLHQQEYAILYFDIDDFKFLNTAYGNHFGDELLLMIAKTLTRFIGKEGLCARQGSDNFYLLVNYHEQLIEQLKNELYQTIQKESSLNIAEDITFCFGACKCSKQFSDIKILMDNAVMSHKNAKKQGRGSILWYNDAFMQKLFHENMIIKHMHHALEDEDYQMFLQPKFEIATGKIIAAEALVRWSIPTYGNLMPDEFIPLFESNGFIFELDFYMLKKVCEFLKAHHLENKDFTISVNISRVTIYHKEFYERIIEIIKTYEIAPSSIELEITESAFNGLDNSIIETLTKLQRAGFSISIDDFGTGYSTLNLLNTLPIDILKIDRGFLNAMNRIKSSVGIIELIIGVSHTLDIRVICEGVETKKQLQYLKDMKCDYGQGYLVSKPIDAEDFYKTFLQAM